MEIDELFLCLQHMFPGSMQAREWLVGQPCEFVGGPHSGAAVIYEWRLKDKPQPTDAEIQAVWETHGETFRAQLATEANRMERDARLVKADCLVNRAADQGNAEAEAKARAYRQALRDVPQQAGFPLAIEWPPVPQ
jgi:hypothetical protein